MFEKPVYVTPNGKVELEEIETENLPAEMRDMTDKEK